MLSFCEKHQKKDSIFARWANHFHSDNRTVRIPPRRFPHRGSERLLSCLSCRLPYCGSYLAIFLPVLVIEFMWSLSENLYASVYGHIGTPECAAMTLTYPVQGLTVGALSGLSQAAGILIGKELGKGETNAAYQKSKRLLLYGLIGSFLLAALTVLAMGVYTDFYNVENYVKATARQILIAFAIVLPVKVLNMILGGGIVRSGGQTRTMMIIELLGRNLFLM